MLLTVPAVATKAPELVPPFTVMPEGTVSVPELLDKLTETELPGAPDSVTVQLLVWPVPSDTGVQLTLDSSTAIRLRLKVCETEFAVAVSVAV